MIIQHTQHDQLTKLLYSIHNMTRLLIDYAAYTTGPDY